MGPNMIGILALNFKESKFPYQELFINKYISLHLYIKANIYLSDILNFFNIGILKIHSEESISHLKPHFKNSRYNDFMILYQAWKFNFSNDMPKIMILIRTIYANINRQVIVITIFNTKNIHGINFQI